MSTLVDKYVVIPYTVAFPPLCVCENLHDGNEK